MSDYSIGLCTMSFNPRLTVNAIMQMDYQDYDYPMTQYVLYQADVHNCYPRHYAVQNGILKQSLKQINVPGKWPGIWWIKFLSMLNLCKEPFMAIVDEDDLFPPNYLTLAMQPIIENPHVRVSWSHTNRQISNGKIVMARYPSPWGTIVAHTATIRDLAIEFERMYPRGLVMSTRHHGWHGPIDMPFRKFIIAKLGQSKIAEHKAIRSYTWGSGCATDLAHHRQANDNIGYGYDGEPLQEIAECEDINAD